MKNWTVTYQIVTEESAENGEADEIGTLGTFDNLRDAMQCVTRTRTCHVGGCEVHASASVLEHASWLTVQNGMEFLTGAHEARSLHFPDNVTGASRKRIYQLLKGV